MLNIQPDEVLYVFGDEKERPDHAKQNLTLGVYNSILPKSDRPFSCFRFEVLAKAVVYSMVAWISGDVCVHRFVFAFFKAKLFNWIVTVFHRLKIDILYGHFQVSNFRET